MQLAALLATAAGIAGSFAVTRGRFELGGALLAASVILLRWPRSLWTADSIPEPSPAVRRAALLAVCGVAVFFRVYHLNPPGLWGDDALNGLLAFDILDGKIRSPFEIIRHSHSNFHALSNYPIAAAFRLFGADPITLRLPGIVLGALCVPLLYGAIAPLFGPTVALIAALFCASSPPQLTHSKELIQIITGAFFQLAGLCLLVRGLAARRAWMIAAAGLPLALCVYTYHSARLAPLVAAIYVVAHLFSARRQPTAASGDARAATRTRGVRIPVVAMIAVFALSLTPAVVGYVRDPAALTERLAGTSIWPILRTQHSAWPLWETSWRTLLAFHYEQGPEYYWFGIAEDPAVNVVLGFLLVHGVVESVRRLREPRHILLLAWFAVGMMPGVLSTGAPRIYRIFLALPPLYVWAALPVARMLAAPVRGRAGTLVRALGVACVAAVPLIDFNYYFYRLYTHPSFRWFQGERLVEMARTLRSFGPGWTGYLLSDNFTAEHESLRFLARAWDLRIVDVRSLSDVLPLQDIPDRGALFIMSHGALGAAPAIAHVYPGAELITKSEPAPRSWWFDAWLPLAGPPREPRINAAFYPVERAVAGTPRRRPPIGLLGEYQVLDRTIARREPYPYYAFLAAPFLQPFDAVWRGQLTIPEPGGFHVEVDTNVRATLRADGRIVTIDDALPPGPHDITLELRRVSPNFRLAMYWRGPKRARELIPPTAFAPVSPRRRREASDVPHGGATR